MKIFKTLNKENFTIDLPVRARALGILSFTIQALYFKLLCKHILLKLDTVYIPVSAYLLANNIVLLRVFNNSRIYLAVRMLKMLLSQSFIAADKSQDVS